MHSRWFTCTGYWIRSGDHHRHCARLIVQKSWSRKAKVMEASESSPIQVCVGRGAKNVQP